MYIELTKSMFRDEFKRCGRGNQFTYEGLGHLYDYLTEIEAVEGPQELDVIALCCDYAEYEISSVLRDYNLSSIEELGEKTAVLWHDDDLVLFQQF